MQTLEPVITREKLPETRPFQPLTATQQVQTVNPYPGEETERCISSSDSLKILHNSLNRFVDEMAKVHIPVELEELCAHLNLNSSRLLHESDLNVKDFMNTLLRRVNYCLNLDLSDREASEYSVSLEKLSFFQKELWAFRNLIFSGLESKSGESFDPTATIRHEIVTYQPVGIIELLTIRNVKALKLVLEERCDAFLLFLRSKKIGDQINAFSVFQFDGIIDALDSINAANMIGYIEHLQNFVKFALRQKAIDPILLDAITTFEFELKVIGRKSRKLINKEA